MNHHSNCTHAKTLRPTGEWGKGKSLRKRDHTHQRSVARRSKGYRETEEVVPVGVVAIHVWWTMRKRCQRIDAERFAPLFESPLN